MTVHVKSIYIYIYNFVIFSFFSFDCQRVLFDKEKYLVHSKDILIEFSFHKLMLLLRNLSSCI